MGEFYGDFEIVGATEVDVYAVMPSVSGSHTFSVGGPLDSQLRIYDSHGTALGEMVDDFFGGENLTQDLTAGSWYFVAVAGYEREVGEYSFSIEGPEFPAPPLTVLPPNYVVDVNSRIDFGGEQKFWTITAPAGAQNGTLVVSPDAALDAVLMLFASDGSGIDFADLGGQGQPDTLTSEVNGGDHLYIGVFGFSPTDVGSFALDVEFEVDPSGILDHDGDGVLTDIENAGPHGGDGNGDGTLDSLQPHVASLPHPQTGKFATLAAPTGTVLQNVAIVAAPPLASFLTGMRFDTGFFQFELADVAPGGAAVVTLYLDQVSGLNSFYRFGPTPAIPIPHWYRFAFDGADGARIFPDRIELSLRDGGRGDDDLAANGTIFDLGAPAADERPFPWQNPRSRFDVNDDEQITPLDVLTIILEINNSDAHALPVPPLAPDVVGNFFDVSGDDNWVTALDVLLTINDLNTNGSRVLPEAASTVQAASLVAAELSIASTRLAPAFAEALPTRSAPEFRSPLPAASALRWLPDRYSNVPQATGNTLRFPVASADSAWPSALFEEWGNDSLETALAAFADEIAGQWNVLRN